MTNIRTLYCLSLCLLCTLLGAEGPSAEGTTPPADPRIELEFLPVNPYETDSERKEIAPDFAKYFLHLHGFPREKDLIFSFFRPVIEKTVIPFYEEAFHINRSGIIDGLYPERYPFIVISADGFLPGEKIKACIYSKDNSIRQEFMLIPHPMHAESSDRKLSLESELILHFPTMYRLRIKGLNDGDAYTFESRSGGEVIKENRIFLVADIITIMPGVMGKNGGNGTVFITNETGSEVSMKLPWGKQLAPYLDGKCYYPD